MPVMPGVIWRGDKSGKRRMDRYDVFCIHTIVGYAPAHAAHFSVFADGDIYQSRDTIYTSAANLDGNHRVIASENEDHGPRFGGTPRLPGWVPLTPEQVAANGQILAWLHDEHGIPLQMNPDSRPTSRGLGYHRQGIDGNFGGYRFGGRVSGGEKWTSSYGKVCPTDARIAQLPQILELARTQGDDMYSDDDRARDKRIEAMLVEDARISAVVRKNDRERYYAAMRAIAAEPDAGKRKAMAEADE